MLYSVVETPKEKEILTQEEYEKRIMEKVKVKQSRTKMVTMT
jgi:hypothetical protein